MALRVGFLEGVFALSYWVFLLRSLCLAEAPVEETSTGLTKVDFLVLLLSVEIAVGVETVIALEYSEES